MKRMILTISALSVFGLAEAVPVVVENSVVVQQRGAQRAKVTYQLAGAPAIVTVDFCTNGVSIGAANCKTLSGDVNKLVETDGIHTLSWNVYEDWPGFAIDDESLTAVVTAWSPSYPPDYMSLELSGAKGVRYYTCAEVVPGGVTNDVYKTDRLLLRKIHACDRTFRMGSSPRELGRSDNEQPHLVTLTNDFYLGVYPITQKQQLLVSGSTGGSTFTDRPDSPLRPANNGSLKLYRGRVGGVNRDAPSAPSLLRDLKDKTGLSFDVPTEAQWEFACRAGSEAALYDGQDLEDATASERLAKLGWHVGNAEGETHPVGQKEPNAFGLYDMLGNVWELVLDEYTDYLGTSEVVEPYTSGRPNVMYRGGGFNVDASRCRSAARANNTWSTTDAAYGIRVMLPVK